MTPPDRAEIPNGYVAVGRTMGSHGLKGELKIQVLAPDEAFRKGKHVSISGQTFAIERFHRADQVAHLKLTGVDFRDQASALRGFVLMAEGDLEPPEDGRYYHYQLIGLPVVSTEGEPLGEIADILTTASNEVFVVQGPRGEILVPAIEDIVLSIDLESRLVTIEVVPGLLPG